MQLHTLIGKREKAWKRASFGNTKAEEEHRVYEKEVQELLKANPELESQVDIVEEHFLNQLYG
ncbi:MAG: hypothetical protein ACOYL8_01215 [Patescibacteria group bacterium]